MEFVLSSAQTRQAPPAAGFDAPRGRNERGADGPKPTHRKTLRGGAAERRDVGARRRQESRLVVPADSRCVVACCFFSRSSLREFDPRNESGRAGRWLTRTAGDRDRILANPPGASRHANLIANFARGRAE